MSQTPHTDIACIILAAGQGTRMKSDLPKVLHPVAGLSMVGHVLKACEELGARLISVVVAPGADAVVKAVLPNACVLQPKPLGTGDAVKSAKSALESFKGDVMVLFADGPLITQASLQLMCQKKAETGAAIVVAGFVPKEPGPYGRLIVDASGTLNEIVEASEASPEQKKISLCNGGAILFDGAKIWPLIDGIRDSNAKKEFFLTDAIKLARAAGDVCSVATIPQDDVLGVNTRVELAHAEKIMQKRLRRRAMLAGVTMTDPDTVYLSFDTKIGRDVVIGPNVVIGLGVEIADKVEVRAFCALEHVRIESGATIGPFSRLRPGAVIGENAHIGNFVEIKNSTIGKGTKINHLSYVGDASVGEKVNVGAGAITANYDGFKKSRTNIGESVSVGANAVLVAPVSVGGGAYIAAGSVITNDVPSDALAVARGRQANLEGWARRMREDKTAKDKK